jgi:hypothetical protein
MILRMLVPEERDLSVAELFLDPRFTPIPLPDGRAVSLAFMTTLSEALLKDPAVRRFPELIAFAYWARPASVRATLERASQPSAAVCVPRGLAFHIAPGNVDTIFLYSWCMSLLAGNTNVVRVSQGLGEPVSLILACLKRVLAAPGLAEIARRNVVITYAHSDAINAALSARAAVRIIWGGDVSVDAIRRAPLPPHGKDLAFPDRVSYSAVAVGRYLALDEAGRASVAQAFFNDAYWFDQKACSSPVVVFFIGPAESAAKASPVFWNSLSAELARRRFENPTAVVSAQMVDWFVHATRTVQPHPMPTGGSPAVVRVALADLPEVPVTCGGGFFLETFVETLEEILPKLTPKGQTLGTFGLEAEELRSFAQAAGAAAPCRIVPIGSALAFDNYWDGSNLLAEFSKLVYFGG